MFFRNNIKSTDMIVQTKDQYISPESEELDVRLEGVIAASLGPYSGFGDEETM